MKEIHARYSDTLLVKDETECDLAAHLTVAFHEEIHNEKHKTAFPKGSLCKKGP